MTTIFASEAPRYWAAGLPAIPLMEKQKRPAVNGWQLFADRLPTEEEKEAWLNHFPDGNIGLPMGPAAGLVAVDIDSEDPTVLKVLDAVLPKSPWTRIGKRGAVKVFRYNGERTTRIKASDNTMICEILSKGTQFVLPPSIHPDTQLPYQANCHLLDVLSIIPSLPVGFEDLLRGALKDAGVDVSVGGGSNKVTTFVPAGARDNTMVWHAGLLARAVTRGERTLLEALGEMQQWVENYVEQVVGDPLTVEKARQKVIYFLTRDVGGSRRIALPIGWDNGLTEEDKANLGLSFGDDDEIWDHQRIIAYLSQEFESHPDHDSTGRIVAIETVLARIARADGGLSRLDEDRILNFIVAQSGKSLNLSSLRAQVKELRRSGDIAGENHHEIAMAVKGRMDAFGELRFDAGRFWQWKGAQWSDLEENMLRKMVGENFGNLPASRRHSDYRQIVHHLGEVAAKELQRCNVIGINFANAYLTREFELLPHNPDHGCTYVLPYRYVAESAGDFPMFWQFLIDSWGHDSDFAQKVLALQEAIGAILFGAATRHQRAFCLYGVAGSGKSALADVIQGLLPVDSICNVAPDSWGDKFLPAQMFGKLLNRAGELSETSRIPGDIFKQLVAGEAIEAQFKHRDVFRFEPRCAQLFCSNHHPKSRDFSKGFSRRWLILEFNKPVDPAKRDTEVANKILSEEREAIAAWAVEGFKRLQQRHEYTLPPSHAANIQRMISANNPVHRFLTTSGKFVFGKDAGETSVSLVQLYGEYTQWSFAEGSRRLTSGNFDERLREIADDFGILVDSYGGDLRYRGIALAAQCNAGTLQAV